MADLIHAACTACGHTVKVQASLAGRKARCPKCQGIIQIPRPAEVSAPPPTGITRPPVPEPAPDPSGIDPVEQTKIEAPRWEPPSLPPAEDPVPEADFREISDRLPPYAEPPGLDADPPPPAFDPPAEEGYGAVPVEAPSPFAPAGGGVGRRSSHGGTASRGRKSSIYAGQAPRAPSRLPMMLTVVFAVLGLGALAVALLFMFRKPVVTPSPTPMAETPSPSPTRAEPSPEEKLRAEIESRTRAWVEAFNTNDPDRMEPFYTITKRELLRICEKDFFTAEVRYANFEIAEITAGPETSYVRIKYDRVRTEKASRLKTEDPRREKLLTWRRSGSTWVLSGPPEP